MHFAFFTQFCGFVPLSQLRYAICAAPSYLLCLAHRLALSPVFFRRPLFFARALFASVRRFPAPHASCFVTLSVPTEWESFTLFRSRFVTFPSPPRRTHLNAAPLLLTSDSFDSAFPCFLVLRATLHLARTPDSRPFAVFLRLSSRRFSLRTLTDLTWSGTFVGTTVFAVYLQLRARGWFRVLLVPLRLASFCHVMQRRTLQSLFPPFFFPSPCAPFARISSLTLLPIPSCPPCVQSADSTSRLPHAGLALPPLGVWSII